jgi:outer membrane protein assembly factor BamE
MSSSLSRITLGACCCALLAGCQTMSSVGSSVSSGASAAWNWGPTFLGPYRPDVHQGNIITKEMVDQLRLGMTREQVRFMLGTPLLTSEFHRDRWDYVYYLNPRRGEVQNRLLTIHFKDNKLDRFTGGRCLRSRSRMSSSSVQRLQGARAAPKQPEKPPEIQTPPPRPRIDLSWNR